MKSDQNLGKASRAAVVSSGHGDKGAQTELAQDDIEALDKIGIKLRFARNETIFSEGEEAAFSYRVVSGAIRLCKHLVDGRRQISDFVLPGDYCGFLHLERHRFTAEATNDLEVIAYPHRQVEALGESMPSMRRRLNDFLSRRLMGVQDHLIMLGRQTAKERVLNFLLRLATNAGAENGEVVSLPMNRQDMADYLGLTIETVSRVMTDLKRSHVVTLPELHEFAINDMESARETVGWQE
jgi:CRP/FNR family nitrogen fixation transcriptional regulator